MCEHDLAEKDTAIADGTCPICSEEKITKAIAVILDYAQIDGSHHKAWVLDQTLRILLGDKYEEIIEKYKDDGQYDWDCGIAP